MKSKKWSYEEELLLVNLYIKSQNATEDFQLDEAIRELSENLRKYAIYQGYSIDETYRNTFGISMKLKNIEYVATNGKSGLSSFSQKDRNIYRLFEHDPKKFYSRVENVEKRINYISQNFEKILSDFENTYNSYKNKNLEIEKENKVTCISNTPSDDYHKNYSTSQYSDIFNVNPIIYDDISIVNLHLGTRAFNRMIREKIFTICELLKWSPYRLSKINGLGNQSIIEIEEALKNVLDKHIGKQKIFSKSINKKIFLKKEDYYDIFGFEGLNQLINNVEIKNYVYTVFYDINKEILSEKKKVKLIQESIDDIPINRKKRKISYYLQFLDCTLDIKTIVYEKIHKDVNFFELYNHLYCFNNDELNQVHKFILKCSIDFKSSFLSFLDNLKQNEIIVIVRRASGLTLNDVGVELNITRERIRQIEKKALLKFDLYINDNHILELIDADNSLNGIITNKMIENIYDERKDVFIYMLSSIKNNNYTYDKSLKIFLSNHIIENDYIDKMIEKMPYEISVFDFNNINEEEINTDIILKKLICENYYFKYGDIYYKNKLTIKSALEYILKKDFKNGIHAYDSGSLNYLRDKAKEYFGSDDIFPKLDRALSANILRYCVLCDRGTYKIKQDYYIPKSLENSIKNYIENSNASIILINTIFEVFKEELINNNIDNKYYLQGILGELFSDEFYFHRDYVAKNKEVTSIHNELIEFIKRFEYPISKEKIQSNYPGITDIVIFIAMEDDNIINYFGSYLHSSRLKLDKLDISYIKQVIDDQLNKNETIHIRSVFDYLKIYNPAILSKNYIDSNFSLFSVVHYLFKDDYSFQRPFLTRKNAKVIKFYEQLRLRIEKRDVISVKEILLIAKEINYRFNSILELLNSLNDEYLIYDAETLISINKLNITEEDVKKLEIQLQAVVNETVPIKSILNQINILNNEKSDWLIYSIINKWSQKFKVTTNQNIFKNAIPIIYRADKSNKINEYTLNQEKSPTKYDDLSNIDELIEDYIEL